jgi:predicted SAM-dependent methyltransferase
MVVLNVGCGPTRIAGEIGVDLHPTGGCDVQADLMALPFADGSVDGVRLDHVLEHLDQRQAVAALAEARRVLARWGMLTVGVPDLAQYADAWRAASLADKTALLRGIYGGQTHAGEYHRSGWDADLLADVLEATGFGRVVVRDDDGPFRLEGYCITASGVKP